MGTSKSRFRNAVGVFATMDVLLPALLELRHADSDPVDFDLMARRSALEASALCHLHRDADRDEICHRLEIGGSGPGDAQSLEQLELIEVGADRADSPVLLSQGRLSQSVLEAGGGPGVRLQPLLRRWLSARSGTFLMERIDDGELLLWVRVSDGEQEARTCRTFLAHSRHQVQVHDLPVPGRT